MVQLDTSPESFFSCAWSLTPGIENDRTDKKGHKRFKSNSKHQGFNYEFNYYTQNIKTAFRLILAIISDVDLLSSCL